MKLAVFGTGGLAKELIGYLVSDGHEVAYAVSTEKFSGSSKFDNVPVYGRVQGGVDGYVLGVSEPDIKRKLVAENEDRWITFAHSSAFVSPHATVGRGCILTPQTIVAGDCVLGNFGFMNTNASVGHDSRIGDYSTLMPNSEVCGNVIVGEDVFIGIGAYVVPYKNVGNRAKLSAGCVVRHPVAEDTTVYGDPAAPRKK